MNKNNAHISPAEFYRMRRPEVFSDSEILNEVELPQEVLAFELNNITTNQKENDFEFLCRRLAEKFISPNLIPQVGPTGGGDGKTDSETYPVSSAISDRWFIPENGWEKDEKWAFAISAQKTWRSKAKSDVKKIIETERGYTRVYFMTNQFISSKKKKDAQDKFIKQFNIDVVILDGKWILEKIYNNSLIELVVDCLNMTQVYKKKKSIIGARDAQRSKKLEEIENNIINPQRYFEYDFQIVEDALEAAILSRMLEKPRDEVEGKFNRAFRFCKKVNDDKQWIRLFYQRAWTYLNWYNDYSSFINDYKSFKVYISKYSSISEIELYFNLFNLLRGISSIVNLKDFQIDIEDEKTELIEILSTFEINDEKPCSVLISKTYKSLIELVDSIVGTQKPEPYLNKLCNIIKSSNGFIGYPFESFKQIIEEMGDILASEKSFDKLIDEIATQSEKRNSEKSTGKIYLRRGIQKLEAKLYKESVIYFGKTVMKLSKEESQYEMFLSLIGLGFAYSELGLIWASNNCFISAAFISFKPWFENGEITSQAIHCTKQLAINEQLIGRIPSFLSWHELYVILSRQINITESEQEIPDNLLFDGCLTTRLLNTDFTELSRQTLLPDLLEKHDLIISRNCLLYMLGYTDLLLKESSKNIFNDEKSLDDFFLLAANQPFRKQMLYKTNFVSEKQVCLTSKILGCEFVLKFESNNEMMLVAETLLAFFEGFLATSLEGVYPKNETITINIIENKKNKSIEFNQNETSGSYNFIIMDFNVSNKNIDYIRKSMIDFTSHLLFNNFFIKDPLDYIQNLFEKEELNERLSLIFYHRNFSLNILGNQPKFFLKDWLNKAAVHEYPLKRQSPVLFHIEDIKRNTFGKDNMKLNNVTHDKRRVLSLIDDELWKKAGWIGFGVRSHPIHGLGIMLGFKNGDIGQKIFNKWIERVGINDKEELIRISIVRGINKDNPNYYRVLVTANIDKNLNNKEELTLVTARIHEMEPNDSKSLEYLINEFNSRKEYKLYPAGKIYEKNGFEPYFSKGILKRELNIRHAWEVSEQDIESVAIKENDKPIIPKNIIDAPVLKLLKKKRYMSKKK